MNFLSSPRAASLGLLFLIGLAAPALGQTTYTWNTSVTSGNWNTPGDWTANSSYPGSAGGSNTDTANISNLSANTTVTYNVTNGSVGTVNMLQTTNTTAVKTQLLLSQNMTINTAMNLNDSVYAGGNYGSGDEYVNVGSGLSLTIASGASLNIGSSTNTTMSNNTYWTEGSGTIVVNGTMNIASGNSGGVNVDSGAALTLNGTLDIQETTNASDRFYSYGTFAANSGSTIESTGTLAYTAFSGIFLNAASNTFQSGVTFTNLGGITIYQASSTNTQSLSAGSLFSYILRDGVAGTSSSPVTATQLYTSTATGNATDEIQLQNGEAYSTQLVKLGSNLVLASGQTTPFLFATNGTSSGQTIDLEGYKYDASTNAGVAFSPGSIAATSNQLNINNSGTSSLANGNGTLEATSFTLNGSDTGIGNGVILQATGASANNLGNVSGGTTGINAGSTFYYTGGTGTGTLTSNRSVGAVVVGTGSSASDLQLASAITAAGNVTVASGATLDLNNKALSLTGTNLIGAGTIASSTSGGTIAFTTGGLTPGGGTVGATTASLTVNSGSTVNLGVTGTTLSTSVFNIYSGSSYDKILGSGAFNLNDANLTVDLLSGFSSPGNYNLFTNTSMLTGTFVDAANVTLEGANASAYTASFSGDTLSITAVAAPEPATWSLLVVSLTVALGLGCARRRFDPCA